MVKKLFSVLLVGFFICISLCTPISMQASTLILDDINDSISDMIIEDDENSGISPLYSYTASTSSTLSFSGSTATCKSVVVGMSGYVTKIVFTQKLQQKVSGSWTTIKTWTTTKNQVSASVVNTKSSMSAGTYRLKTSAKVYNGTAYETVTSTSTTIIYG